MPMMTYDPFWRMMDERRISTYSLEVDYSFNKAFIHRLNHNKNMNLSSIDYICEIFCCSVEDVVVHIRNDCNAGEGSFLKVGERQSRSAGHKDCNKWQIPAGGGRCFYVMVWKVVVYRYIESG